VWCRYLLKELAIASRLQTCFSNRLLPRLVGSFSTIEALMIVAFKWETACRAALATILDVFFPNYQWFWAKYVKDSRLVKEFKRGITVLASDEAFTIHPLLMAVLLWLVESFCVVFPFMGEALQIDSMQDDRMLKKGWHERFAFNMEPWLTLERTDRALYFQLRQNFRLPQNKHQMLMRVSC
jgi:hypothetical protein